MNIGNSLNTLPILFLAVSCNFTGNLLSCENQEIFTNNMYVKHFVLYMILLITVVYTNKQNFVGAEQSNFLTDLLKIIGYSIFIYVSFALMVKMRFVYIVLALIILVIHSFITDYKKNHIDPENLEKIKQYEQIELVLQIIFAINLIIGVGLYFDKQRRDHGSDFKLEKFFIGTSKCRRI